MRERVIRKQALLCILSLSIILIAFSRTQAIMSVSIKTPQEIEKMRTACRLAAELLDYITPFV
ncbi:MAG TPA: hypothetical protein VKG67_06270, partial [Gallionellaceae bacterium]|nr:hypothetical protein [Gallionellaceae bacterium]